MSWLETAEPTCTTPAGAPALATVIQARPRDIGGFIVGRVLPAAARRSVGPFVFLDHMGPSTLAPGQGIDVLPHPHIGLATVTSLFEGAIMHRDSLGSVQEIQPGDVNWMSAGRGIVHSERTPPALRAAGSSLHGLQIWVALPRPLEDGDPSFQHVAAESLPERADDGVRLRVLAGSAYGLTSPVVTPSPLFYVDATIAAGFSLPLPEEHEERAVYVVTGAIRCGAERVEAGRLAVFMGGSRPELRAETAAHVALIGGPPLDGGPRHMFWNFVSSSKERVDQAARDWQEGRFPRIPGDDQEFVPLPSWPRR